MVSRTGESPVSGRARFHEFELRDGRANLDEGRFWAFSVLKLFLNWLPTTRRHEFLIEGSARAGAIGIPGIRPRSGTSSGFRLRRFLRPFGWLCLVAACAWLVGYELRTSSLQSRIVSYYAQRMSYTIERGPSPRILFPKSGPFDVARGYSLIPGFEARLEARNFEISEQARFSPELLRIARWGVPPPYREPAATALTIYGENGVPLFRRSFTDRLFRSYEDIPPLVVQTLLLMENRELAESDNLNQNPVVEWDRLAKAGLVYAGAKIGLPLRREGGSTLATQIEKFQHSYRGRTGSLSDKLLQMAAATLKVYHGGRDTRMPRREIVLDYLNTVPLSATPTTGELHGLGDGLYGWFNTELASSCRLLDSGGVSADKALAFKQVIALLAAVRAPTYYLVQNRQALERRMALYMSKLEEAGIIDHSFSNMLLATPISFASPDRPRSDEPFARMKASNAMRTQLLSMLGVPSLYDLDRLHLEAQSTVDVQLQNRVAAIFDQLHDPEFVSSKNLRQDRLLLRGDPSKVIYSLMLYERTPRGNELRVQTDNLDEPFDLNTGVKMELGSTAKLRTLAHYLDIVTQLRAEMAHWPQSDLAERARSARDPITRWAAETLESNPQVDLDSFLSLALERKYSASPGEVFFTGGGVHTFVNFDPKDNGRVLTVREATQRSVNLVYIRLMRDLVRFHEARLPYDIDEVLLNDSHPVRMRMLSQAAETEATQILMKSYRNYRGATPDEVLRRFLGTRRDSNAALAVLFYAWKPEVKANEDPEAALSRWLTARKGAVTAKQVHSLAKAYGNPRLNLLDYAYLLRRHPLDLFCAGAVYTNPRVSWTELWRQGAGARAAAASWLFNTRHRGAQELRLRIRFEMDAFERMTPYWQRLGFPFARLTPSYATAIGSSGDRPSALADLMGIIVNDGARLPDIRFTELRFAHGTPYQTVFAPRPVQPEQVLSPAVARTIRSVLAEVVTVGTARRIDKAFVTPEGLPVQVGGKTGSGDNRFESFSRGGHLVGSRVVNRTAAFVFYVGERYFGVMLAFVPGSEAAQYKFTSALPVSILRLLSPAINRRLG